MFYYGKQLGFYGASSKIVQGEIKNDHYFVVAREMALEQLSQEEYDAFLDTIADDGEPNCVVAMFNGLASGNNVTDNGLVIKFFGDDYRMAVALTLVEAKLAYLELCESMD